MGKYIFAAIEVLFVFVLFYSLWFLLVGPPSGISEWAIMIGVFGVTNLVYNLLVSWSK